MPTSIQRLPHPSRSSYSIYSLEALDGVLAYVTLDGETVAFCFGADEQAAAEAVAARVGQPVSSCHNGLRR
jgi:hypothetical protein